MNETRETIVIENPETSSYLVYRPSTTSSYITTAVKDSTPDPSCLGQIIKNKILITGSSEAG